MNDDHALNLLAEMLENVKNVTELYPYAFYECFLSFVKNLLKTSNHIKNDNLRECSLYFLLLFERPFSSAFESRFQDLVLNELKTFPEREIREVLLGIVAETLNPHVLSDYYGRDIIDVKRLRKDLEDSLKGFDEPTSTLIISEISNAIRKIMPRFIDEGKREILEFYNKLLESCKIDWMHVRNTLRQYLLKWDRVAIVWKRV